MAKEEAHKWGRFILLGIFIVFATGGWVVKVLSNTEAITRVQIKVQAVEEDVHKLQLKDKDLANMAEKSLMFMSQVDTKLDSIVTEQKEQAVINAVNSEKLQQLTKDE